MSLMRDAVLERQNSALLAPDGVVTVAGFVEDLGCSSERLCTIPGRTGSGTSRQSASGDNELIQAFIVGTNVVIDSTVVSIVSETLSFRDQLRR